MVVKQIISLPRVLNPFYEEPDQSYVIGMIDKTKKNIDYLILRKLLTPWEVEWEELKSRVNMINMVIEEWNRLRIGE